MNGYSGSAPNSICLLPLADIFSGRCRGETKDGRVSSVPPSPSHLLYFQFKGFPLACLLGTPQQSPLPSTCPCNEDTGRAVWWEGRCGTGCFLSMTCRARMWKKPSFSPWLHKENKVLAQMQRSPFNTGIKPGRMNPIVSESWAQERHLHLVATLFCAAWFSVTAAHWQFLVIHIFQWESMQNVICYLITGNHECQENNKSSK